MSLYNPANPYNGKYEDNLSYTPLCCSMVSVALMVEDIVATSAREGGPVSYSSSSGFRPKIIQNIEDIQKVYMSLKNLFLMDTAEFYTTVLRPSVTLLYYVKSCSVQLRNSSINCELLVMVETRQKGIELV